MIKSLILVDREGNLMKGKRPIASLTPKVLDLLPKDGIVLTHSTTFDEILENLAESEVERLKGVLGPLASKSVKKIEQTALEFSESHEVVHILIDGRFPIECIQLGLKCDVGRIRGLLGDSADVLPKEIMHLDKIENLESFKLVHYDIRK